MDAHNRRSLAWRLGSTHDARFCVTALNEARVRYGAPAAFNSDQGAQFTTTAPPPASCITPT